MQDLKALQIETGQTISSLRMALRDKDNELNRLRDTSSTVRSTDTSALNVADYDLKQDTIDSNKIEHLTQTLVLRQSKIDKLLADNNILKIQLEKLEVSKCFIDFPCGDRLRIVIISIRPVGIVRAD